MHQTKIFFYCGRHRVKVFSTTFSSLLFLILAIFCFWSFNFQFFVNLKKVLWKINFNIIFLIFWSFFFCWIHCRHQKGHQICAARRCHRQYGRDGSLRGGRCNLYRTNECGWIQYWPDNNRFANLDCSLNRCCVGAVGRSGHNAFGSNGPRSTNKRHLNDHSCRLVPVSEKILFHSIELGLILDFCV